MWKKRAIGWIILCMAVFSLLLFRLMQIQLFKAETFSKHHINLLEESVRQRTQEMVIDDGRGNFLDRNGKILTYQKKAVLVLFPFLAKTTWNIQSVSAITGIPVPSIKTALSKAKQPFAFGDPHPIGLIPSQMERINALKIPGVLAIEKKYERLSLPAEQLIGLTGENPEEFKNRYPDRGRPGVIGISGLEQSFDEFLLPEGESKLVYHVDGDSAPLFGTDIKYVDPGNPFFPVNVRTTIDQEIQQKAEELVEKHQIQKGGLVLLNLKDNSVLAMVSRPNVNKKDPYSSGITNQMVKQQIMGSVFKTVIAAAAIDSNLDSPSRVFDCNKKINGEPENTYNYGRLNFTDSFARSCNRTFGELAVELQQNDKTIIEHYANKLSLTGPVGWQGDIFHIRNFKQFSNEERGRVFLTNSARSDRNYIAMSGIGQDEVRATPLAVANMMATIARGGKKEAVRAVYKIEYKNGATMVQFPEQELKGDSISPYTAMNLQKLLREVVINNKGTGRSLQNLPFDVAGKSGTAETQKFKNGEQLHNKWFAGYFPFKNPEYALVAVNLDVYENEGGVNSLFADMVRMLYNRDQEMNQALPKE